LSLLWRFHFAHQGNPSLMGMLGMMDNSDDAVTCPLNQAVNYGYELACLLVKVGDQVARCWRYRQP
jgi:hypothetical protein